MILWQPFNPTVGEDIDQEWLMEWSMSRPLPGPMHNQSMVRLKVDSISDVQEAMDSALALDGASPNPEHAAGRYRLDERTGIELWAEDPDTGEWHLTGITSELL